MAYPTETDLIQRLQGAGLLDSPTLSAQQELIDFESVLEAARLEFENATRWVPFLQDTEDVTRTFSPNESRQLPLNAGLMELTSLTIAGSERVENTDFWLKGRHGEPATTVEFSRSIWGRPNSIVIVGKWGRVSEITADISEAIIALAASNIASTCYSLMAQGGLASWSEGDVREQYDVKSIEGLRASWQANFNSAVAIYRKWNIA